MIRILAISGSLRQASTNTMLLKAMSRIVPDDITITLFSHLGQLPLFNPDLEGSDPPPVLDFRAQLKAADGVLIASPEYAHGVTGAIKNALDWIVASGELVHKPVALLNAAPRATFAIAALRETVRVMDARIIDEASQNIPIHKSLTIDTIISHPEISSILRTTISAFVHAIQIRDTDAWPSQRL